GWEGEPDGLVHAVGGRVGEAVPPPSGVHGLGAGGLRLPGETSPKRPREVGTARLLQDNGQVVPGGPGVRVGRAEDPFPSGERTLELLSGVIEPTDRGIAAAEIVTGVQSPGPLEAEDLLERL